VTGFGLALNGGGPGVLTCSGAQPVHRSAMSFFDQGSCACRAVQEDPMTRLSFVLMAVLALSHATPSLAQTAAKPAKSAKPAVVAASTEIINLNTATAAQIATLPGVGPKTADLIVQYRQKNGGFKKVEEIL
jgi:hypothetical protein